MLIQNSFMPLQLPEKELITSLAYRRNFGLVLKIMTSGEKLL